MSSVQRLSKQAEQRSLKMSQQASRLGEHLSESKVQAYAKKPAVIVCAGLSSGFLLGGVLGTRKTALVTAYLILGAPMGLLKRGLGKKLGFSSGAVSVKAASAIVAAVKQADKTKV